jgi:hypothetical protein
VRAPVAVEANRARASPAVIAQRVVISRASSCRGRQRRAADQASNHAMKLVALIAGLTLKGLSAWRPVLEDGSDLV